MAAEVNMKTRTTTQILFLLHHFFFDFLDPTADPKPFVLLPFPPSYFAPFSRSTPLGEAGGIILAGTVAQGALPEGPINLRRRDFCDLSVILLTSPLVSHDRAPR